MSSCFQLKKTISRNKIYILLNNAYAHLCVQSRAHTCVCSPMHMQSCTYTQNLFVIKLSMVNILICWWICCIHREM